MDGAADISPRMPCVFLAHGSPLLLDDRSWVGELAAWSAALPAPRAILVLSAHWVEGPITLAATEAVPLLYDFYGFPRRHYEVTYAAPGAPQLAERVRELLRPHGPVVEAPRRGLDHGAYVPLVAMYPAANVPVLQVSLPSLDPAALITLGQNLAPLRDEGVLLMASGFLTHNMHALDWSGEHGTPAWASEFDHWAEEAFAARDVEGLLHYRQTAPAVRTALPTHEHFVPSLVALGASLDYQETVRFPIRGFAYGSFTKRSIQFGA